MGLLALDVAETFDVVDDGPLLHELLRGVGLGALQWEYGMCGVSIM